jgi:hypothetical protein
MAAVGGVGCWLREARLGARDGWLLLNGREVPFCSAVVGLVCAKLRLLMLPRWFYRIHLTLSSFWGIIGVGMNRKAYLLALGWLCASLTAAHSQGTLTLASSSVDLSIAPYQNRANFTFPTAAVSLANYGGVQVTFSAPSGYAWRFDTSRSMSLDCYLLYGAAPTPDQIGYGGNLYTFDFVPGMGNTVSTPLASNSNQTWDSETGLGFHDTFQFGGNVEFTGFTVRVAHSVLQGEYGRQLSLSSFDHAYLDGQSQASPALTLVPIPEPGIAAFAGLGAGLAVIRASGKMFT